MKLQLNKPLDYYRGLNPRKVGEWHWDQVEKFVAVAQQDIAAMAAELASARGALATIHNNTEPDAIQHLSYEHLAANVYETAKAGLGGVFVDDMRSAEVYDQLQNAALSRS